MKNKKVMIAGIIAGVIVITFGALACVGMFRGFDAQRYVKAVLDQTLKGDVEAAEAVMEGVTKKELQEQYEAGIASFVQNSFLRDIETEGKIEKAYEEHCKNIFASMKYKVGKPEKISDGSYRVPVTYQASDVYVKFAESVVQEGQKLKTKMENGEYDGESVEEVKKQMETELLNNSSTLLEDAYKKMGFGEEKTVNLTVKKGKNDLYKVEEDEIAQFIEKIMGLDEIQD